MPSIARVQYSYGTKQVVVDLEKDMSPMVCIDKAEFWNAYWSLRGFWPYEKIKFQLEGENSRHVQFISADDAGNCEFPIAALEPYLASTQLIKLSITRQGFSDSYHLAVYSNINAAETQALSGESQQKLTDQTQKKSPSRRMKIEHLKLVVHGARSYSMQDRLVADCSEMLLKNYGSIEKKSVEYPHGKKAKGNEFIFHLYSFSNLQNEQKIQLQMDIESLIKLTRSKSGLMFSADWSRERR
jgi:hypothetical protein